MSAAALLRRLGPPHPRGLLAWTVVLWGILAHLGRDGPSGPGPLAVQLLGLGVLGAVLGRLPRGLADARAAGLAWGAWLPASVVLLGALLRALAGGARPTGLLAAAPWALLALVLLGDVATIRRLARLAGVEALKTRRAFLFRAGAVTIVLVTLLAGMTHERVPGTTGWSVAAGSLGTGLWAAEVFLLVLGATAIAGEATAGTLKMMLPHAYRRSDWVIAKAIVLGGVAVLFAVVLAGTALAHAAATEGLGDVTRELEPMFGETTAGHETFAPAGLMARHAGASLVAGLAALGVTALLGLALSALLDGVVASLCLAFLLFAGLKFADVLLKLSREALQGIYAWYPDRLLELLDKLGRAINERWDDALLPAGLSVALLTGAPLLLLAIRFFARRDVHA